MALLAGLDMSHDEADVPIERARMLFDLGDPPVRLCPACGLLAEAQMGLTDLV